MCVVRLLFDRQRAHVEGEFRIFDTLARTLVYIFRFQRLIIIRNVRCIRRVLFFNYRNFRSFIETTNIAARLGSRVYINIIIFHHRVEILYGCIQLVPARLVHHLRYYSLSKFVDDVVGLKMNTRCERIRLRWKMILM